jgi:hypothetical protein
MIKLLLWLFRKLNLWSIVTIRAIINHYSINILVPCVSSGVGIIQMPTSAELWILFA